jgi:peptidoglycan/LPS O-acetylase OafA/YrhL
MKGYFKGLDTLRAIAALVVVIGHIELQKSDNGIPNLINHPYIKLASGHVGVVLFFVLSGFLITYLLMKEKEKAGRISFKNFYLRRIFRIWPLYYLIILISFLFFKADYSLGSAALCLTIFPNIAHAFNMGWPTSPQLWSIGVEEQFYLFWPLIITLIPDKKKILYLSIFFIGYSFIPYFITFINPGIFKIETWGYFIGDFFYGSKFNSMCFGGILGFMYATNHKNLKFLYNNYVAYTSFFLAFVLWFSGFDPRFFRDELYTLLFGIVILNIATNDKLKFNIETRLFSFLGKISYGIYMYHWIIILLALKIISSTVFENIIIYNVILYTTVLLGTILLSWISFISFEKYFLNLKKRFETIK